MTQAATPEVTAEAETERALRELEQLGSPPRSALGAFEARLRWWHVMSALAFAVALYKAGQALNILLYATYATGHVVNVVFEPGDDDASPQRYWLEVEFVTWRGEKKRAKADVAEYEPIALGTDYEVTYFDGEPHLAPAGTSTGLFATALFCCGIGLLLTGKATWRRAAGASVGFAIALSCWFELASVKRGHDLRLEEVRGSRQQLSS